MDDTRLKTPLSIWRKSSYLHVLFWKSVWHMKNAWPMNFCVSYGILYDLWKYAWSTKFAWPLRVFMTSDNLPDPWKFSFLLWKCACYVKVCKTYGSLHDLWKFIFSVYLFLGQWMLAWLMKAGMTLNFAGHLKVFMTLLKFALNMQFCIIYESLHNLCKFA